MHPIDHIKKFANLTPELEYAILGLMREYKFKKGDTIRGAVNLTSYAYFISQGAARLFYSQKGKEQTVSFSFDDEFVVISRHVVKKNADTVAIQFLEPTTVIFIPQLRLRDFLVKTSSINDRAGLLFLNTALIHYSSFLEEINDVMQSMSAEERYKWAIERYPRLTQCATTTQIASFLALTKETLYRIKGGKYPSVKSGTAKKTAEKETTE